MLIDFNNNFIFLMILATIWTIPWKGVALWRAAKRGEKGWFIALLIFNTMAILEIIYIFIITRKPPKISSNLNNGGNNNKNIPPESTKTI